MNLGIFAKTYERPTIEEVFAAAAADGMTVVQLNFVSAGLESMPDELDPNVVARVRDAADTHGISISAISATYNMIHPDPAVRERGIRHLAVLAGAAHPLGATTLSLCTGSRDPDNMWRHHPGNDSPDAWADLLTELGRAIAIAEDTDLMLGIEPEPGNVVSTAGHARRLLDETGSSRLGIVLDPANIIEGIQPDEIDGAIDEAVGLLGERTIIAHGKDRDASGAVRPPGRGIVPWDRFLAELDAVGFTGPLILHGLPESAVPDAVTYLRGVIGSVGARQGGCQPTRD
jgi:sugar phosphate isomerase/epimerase